MSAGDEKGTPGTSGEDTTESAQPATRAQLRALAHPLRLEIIDEVRRLGTARAADVAEELSLPANSVSYHLRILARGGVIEEAPEAARDRRDRVWRLTQETFGFGNDGKSLNDPDSTDPEYMEASGATSLAAFDWMRTAWAREVARSTSRPTTPGEGLGSMYAGTLRLSREQAAALNRTVQSELTRYRRLNRDEQGGDTAGDPDSEGEARTYRVLWAAVGEQHAGPDDAPQGLRR